MRVEIRTCSLTVADKQIAIVNI